MIKQKTISEVEKKISKVIVEIVILECGEHEPLKKNSHRPRENAKGVPDG
jgi:hypothetical protein